MYLCAYVCIYVSMHLCIYASTSWSKPRSIKAPQKQAENCGFDPGQASGQTLGKVGGNMPAKLAEMRAKKEQQTK